MLKNVITVANEDLEEFEQYLYERENARATIRKYMTDIRTFCKYLGKEKEADKNRLLLYKEWLLEHYAISSANSMLAALNQFLKFKGYDSLTVKRIKTQRSLFRQEEKELTKGEFKRLVEAARRQGKEQLALCMETIAVTGIRISELQYFTVERKIQKDLPAGFVAEKASGLFKRERNPGRMHFYYTKWKTKRPEQYLERDESPSEEDRNSGKQDFPS